MTILLEKKRKVKKRKKAKIYIENLQPFTGYGAGKYKLNSVKKIVGTEDFYDYGVKNNICQTKETLSECKMKSFPKQVLKQCECIPYEFADIMDAEVFFM